MVRTACDAAVVATTPLAACGYNVPADVAAAGNKNLGGGGSHGM